MAAVGALVVPAQSTELKMWILSGNPGNAQFLTEAETEFQKTHPDFKLVLEQLPNESYKTQLPVALAGSAPPDVFFNWAGEYAARFAKEGQALDITELGAKPGGFKHSLSDAWQSSFELKGRNFGVPTDAVSKYFFYDKEFFAKNNLTPPTTFNGLVKLCKSIRQIDPSMVPWPLGNSERWIVNHVVTMLNERVLGNANTAADYDLSAPADQLFTNPGYVEAWQKLVDLQDAGCFQDAPNATSPEAADQMFLAQVSPMTFCGTWCAATFDKDGYTGYSLFRFPSIEGGKGDPAATFLVPQGYQIAAKSQHPELAAEWVSFLVSNEQAVNYAKLTAAVPSNAALIEQVGGTEQFNWFAKDIAQSTGSVMVLNVLLESAVSEAYLDAGVEVLNRTKTPQQAMDYIRGIALQSKARLGRN
ncbi:ABC transporter substrate-binding protein [Kaistia sp. 32K]|uniref:ABC transporter substrate-binding protein n=1 Tax=Kaistia sp. 32K TaxID=2795690 RepID=UPI001915C723|nr:ABC transporter substrate-binding protein [Kaistia sp. 32K]